MLQDLGGTSDRAGLLTNSWGTDSRHLSHKAEPLRACFRMFGHVNPKLETLWYPENSSTQFGVWQVYAFAEQISVRFCAELGMRTMIA